MKKRVMAVLVMAFALVLVVAGCGGGKDKDSSASKASSKGEKESSETISGASEATSYTALKDLKDKYDIIIVGSGGAGMSAALEAKEKGMNPVIFEKMPVVGGNTLKSSSGMNASETKFQKEQGISDSNDLFYEETLAGGHGTNDKDLLRFFVDNSAGAIDWLDGMGIRLNNITITGGMKEKRTHRPEDGSAVGQYLVKGLIKNVQEKDIPVFINADVTDITEKDNKVTGVKVMFDGKEEKTVSSNAVVVTTGGYGANMDMITKTNPELKGYVTTNQEGSTGDGIKMIEKLGGYTVDMNEIQIHPTVQQDKSYLIGEVVRGEGGILVDADGKRFVNELDTRDNVSKAVNETSDKSAYLIFDAGVEERAAAVAQYKKQGFVKEGKTVADLAKEINIAPETLEATVSKWNENVAAKSDGDFNRTTGMDHDLSKGPYYAIKIAPGIHYTMGGVKINTNTEVLTKEGTPITGLFAAGEVVGGLHGGNRIGGNSVAEIIIFGRQAGEKSAEFVEAAK